MRPDVRHSQSNGGKQMIHSLADTTGCIKGVKIACQRLLDLQRNLKLKDGTVEFHHNTNKGRVISTCTNFKWKEIKIETFALNTQGKRCLAYNRNLFSIHEIQDENKTISYAFDIDFIYTSWP